MNPNSNANDSPPVPLQQVALAVDCHGWEDFPVHLRDEAAAQVLAGWTAMWHPTILAAGKSIPHWQRLDHLPETTGHRVWLLPQFAEAQFPTSDANRFRDLGGYLFVCETDRQQIAGQIIDNLKLPGDFDQTVVSDFFCLGYCYLQIQLMTRQLRFTSSLDDAAFQDQVQRSIRQASLASRNACIDSDETSWKVVFAEYRSTIQNCFDMLIEERTRYYPTTAFFLDYIFVTPQLADERLRQTLRQNHARSIHFAGESVPALSSDSVVATLIRENVANENLTLVGGEARELPSQLISSLSAVHLIERGLEQLQNLVPQARPVYGRRTPGLHVGLPAILDQFDLNFAVHSTLGDGVFPQTSANHIRWEGNDGSTVSAVASPPELAHAAETWLNLGVKIGESIDVSHHACMLFVRWPGRTGDYFQDVCHSARFGSVLGDWVTLAQYLDSVSDPGYSQRYLADDYRGPWLNQLVSAGAINPVSRFTDYWRGIVSRIHQRGFRALESVYFGHVDGESTRAAAADDMDRLHRPLANFDNESVSSANEFAVANDDPPTAASPQPTTYCNGFSFSRRYCIPIDSVDPEHDSVLLADDKMAIVDIPAAGVVDLARKAPEPGGTETSVHLRRSKARQNKRSPLPLTADGACLRNEFFQAEIDQKTGGLAAIKLHGKRANMMAQQLVLRESLSRRSRTGGSQTRTTSMITSGIQVLKASQLIGQIESQGILRRGRQDAAWFRQVATVTRGIPRVDLEMEIKFDGELKGDPWRNYIASRFAWSDESADLFAWQVDSRFQVVRRRIVSPLGLQIDQQGFSTTILTDGRPFHLRIGDRKLDNLLMVQGESRLRFRASIGVNLSSSYQQSLQFMAPPAKPTLIQVGADTGQAWLFHLGSKNVVALDWKPESDGKGVTILLKETEDRKTNLKVSCFRDLVRAEIRKHNGRLVSEPVPEKNSVTIPICPCEINLLTLFW